MKNLFKKSLTVILALLMITNFFCVNISAAEDSKEAFLYKWDGSGKEGDDLYFNVSADGAVYQFTVETMLCDPTTDIYKAVQNLKIGDVVDMEGYLYWYLGPSPHIISLTVKD